MIDDLDNPYGLSGDLTEEQKWEKITSFHQKKELNTLQKNLSLPLQKKKAVLKKAEAQVMNSISVSSPGSLSDLNSPLKNKNLLVGKLIGSHLQTLFKKANLKNDKIPKSTKSQKELMMSILKTNLLKKMVSLDDFPIQATCKIDFSGLKGLN